MASIQITVWVCPTPGCGNYFASSGAPDLSQEKTGKKVEDVAEWEKKTGQRHTHMRSACPDCKALRNGLLVDRKPVTTRVVVPE